MPDVSISCDKLKGAAKYLCRLETEKKEPEEAEKLWSCVEDKFVKAGGTKKQLHKLANKGYEAEPNGFKRFFDDPDKLEWQEKLDFTYLRPEYYSCIANSDLPLQFAMRDFKQETKFDDQTRAKFNLEIDNIKKELAKEVVKYPLNSAGYRRELARRIFDRTVGKDKFYGDCEIECADYEAARYNRGACTETSAVLYYKYRYAGLEPVFYYLHDMGPSLEWVDIVPMLGEAMDHVFIGIPLQGPDSKAKKDLFVDPALKIFDAKHKYGIPISERTFTSFTVFNKFSNLVSHRRAGEAEEVLTKAIVLAPESIYPYTILRELYAEQKREDDRSYMAGYIKRHFKDHPWTVIEAMKEKFQKEKAESGEDAAKKKLVEFSGHIEKMALKNPSLVAMQFYRAARQAFSEFVLMNLKAKSHGGSIDPNFQVRARSIGVGTLLMYVNSLSYDPNFIFAYRDLNLLLDGFKAPLTAVNVYKQLLEKHPEHTPFIYSQAKYLLDAATAAGVAQEQKEGLFLEALKKIKRLEELEPESPQAYALKSTALFQQNKFAAALKMIKRSNELYEQKHKPAPLENYISAGLLNILLRNGDEAVNVAKDIFKNYPKDGLKRLASRLDEHLFWWLRPKQPERIIDEVLLDKSAMSSLEPLRNYIVAVNKVCDHLDKYEEAREYVKRIKAYFLPFIAFIIGRKDAKKWFEELYPKPSDMVIDRLATASLKMAEFFIGMKGTANAELCENMQAYLEMIGPLLKDNRNVFYAMSNGLFWANVLLEDRANAEKILKGLPEKVAAEVMLFSATNLIRFGENSYKNTKRLCFVMDIVGQRLGYFNAAQRSSLVESCSHLASACRKHGLVKEAELAEKMAEKLRN